MFWLVAILGVTDIIQLSWLVAFLVVTGIQPSCGCIFGCHGNPTVLVGWIFGCDRNPYFLVTNVMAGCTLVVTGKYSLLFMVTVFGVVLYESTVTFTNT